MTDALDKQTQALPLEPVKRGRGRPKTGTAMTPAEKQRAYRERQRKLNVQKPAADHQTVQALDQEVRKLLVELECANARIAELEKELQSRDRKEEKNNVTEKEGRYVMQKKSPAGRWLKQCMFDSKREADKAMVGVPVEMVHMYRIKKA